MARVVSTASEFSSWLKRERNIGVVVYFVGNLAAQRKAAARTIRALTRIKAPTPAQAYTLEKLRAQMALVDEAQWHERVGNVHLVQRRGGTGWIYFARRKR